MGSKSKKRHHHPHGGHKSNKRSLLHMSAELKKQTYQQHIQLKKKQKLEQHIHKKKEIRKEEHAKIPYTRHHHTLIIGDGNFSFTVALVQHFLQQQQNESEEHINDDDNNEHKEENNNNNNNNNNNRRPSFRPPKLPPNSLFLSPDIRLISTCYDSFDELFYKYTDSKKNINYLSHYISIYDEIDCLKLQHIPKQKPFHLRQENDENAQEEEKKVDDNNNNDDNDDDDDDEHKYRTVYDFESLPLSSDNSNRYLFPPYFTSLQSRQLLESRASHKLKYTISEDKSSYDYKEKIFHLQCIKNAIPRIQFHRIIFNFPHTGCGIQDTEQNNQIHREFLINFMKSVVFSRLLYAEIGELHITLKKGEPYNSWKIIECSKHIPTLKFKTSIPFYHNLYKGYKHRRTRGAIDNHMNNGDNDDDKDDDDDDNDDELISTNSNDNQDISIGAMTYIFTRERVKEDNDEDEYNQKWMKQYNIEQEQLHVKNQLLNECQRIYDETKKNSSTNDNTTS